MVRIKILDAEFKCLTCGQITKLAHTKCVGKMIEKKLKNITAQFLKDINFYLKRKENHNDKFYVYWNEIRAKLVKRK